MFKEFGITLRDVVTGKSQGNDPKFITTGPPQGGSIGIEDPKVKLLEFPHYATPDLAGPGLPPKNWDPNKDVYIDPIVTIQPVVDDIGKSLGELNTTVETNIDPLNSSIYTLNDTFKTNGANIKDTLLELAESIKVVENLNQSISKCILCEHHLL